MPDLSKYFKEHSRGISFSYKMRGDIERDVISRFRNAGICHRVIIDNYRLVTEVYQSTVPSDGVNPEGLRIWWDYLINRSVFSGQFVDKNATEILERGYVTMVPCGYGWQAVHAFQLARLPQSEYRDLFNTVTHVLATGADYHPFLLLLAATQLNLGVHEGTYIVSYNRNLVQHEGGGHTPFGGSAATKLTAIRGLLGLENNIGTDQWADGSSRGVSSLLRGDGTSFWPQFQRAAREAFESPNKFLLQKVNAAEYNCLWGGATRSCFAVTTRGSAIDLEPLFTLFKDLGL